MPASRSTRSSSRTAATEADPAAASSSSSSRATSSRRRRVAGPALPPEVKEEDEEPARAEPEVELREGEVAVPIGEAVDAAQGGNMPDFLNKVYAITHMIPHGSVTSYGHIAKLAGYPRYSRHVGNAMRDLPTGSTVPWQRVLSSSGHISPRTPASVLRQKRALEAEHVEVFEVGGGGVVVGNPEHGGGGRERVDLRRFGWFPERVDLD